MFPIEAVLAYSAACVLLALAPGPDNLLAIGRGLRQGRMAACISGFASGAGILFPVATRRFDLHRLRSLGSFAPAKVAISVHHLGESHRQCPKLRCRSGPELMGNMRPC